MSATEGGAGGHHHHDEGFVRKYVFSVDHKWIGIQYGMTALVFLFVGFLLMLAMRWQIAHPGVAVPLVGQWLWPDQNGALPPEVYNQFGAMHGTIMVFLGIVPLAVGAFGNYVVPLQIGAPDMAFPRLNMASYWCFLPGGLIMLASFFIPGGAAQSGWTSYPPLAALIDAPGQTFWLIGMVFLITSSLLGSVNFIVTIVQLRAPGMTFFRMPFFVWAQLVTAFLLLLAFPPLEAAGILQLMDRVADTSFFLPRGLFIDGSLVETTVAGETQPLIGGGSAVLWQHLFWFLAHPEVYVLILPALGIVAEIIANNTRKPLWGYKSIVYATIFLGFMSFIVWAHHMFMTGMGTSISTFFQATTMIISIPSVIILTALFISLWGGSIRFTTPMLFALSFLPMFGIGGLTGLPLGLISSDIHLHDTYYVIGHFHYVVAPGTLMALFAGIYYWFPKATGRHMNGLLGKIHFWGSFLCLNGVFLPMFIQGLAGLSRRLSDGGISYAHAEQYLWLNKVMTHSAITLGFFQVFFILNLFGSILGFFGKKVSANPWGATTLEWTEAPSPPVGHGNFDHEITVHRGPCEYSVPGQEDDFTPQTQPVLPPPPAEPEPPTEAEADSGSAEAKAPDSSDAEPKPEAEAGGDESRSKDGEGGSN